MSNDSRNHRTSHHSPASSTPKHHDAPLEIAADDANDASGYALPRLQRGPSMERGAHHIVQHADVVADIEEDVDEEYDVRDLNAETSIERIPPVAIDRALMGNAVGHMSDMLNWALDSMHEPAVAAADWLARDIDPDQPTATALLSDPTISLAKVKQAKSVYKTMRIVGEKSADRRIGARMYAAAIAAGLVRHRLLVSRQSIVALKRGFQGLLDDPRMPSQLRDLAGMALCVLNEKRFRVDAQDEPASDSTRKPPSPRPKSKGKPARNGRPTSQG